MYEVRKITRFCTTFQLGGFFIALKRFIFGLQLSRKRVFFMCAEIKRRIDIFCFRFCLFDLLLYIHGKQLRCQDSQLLNHKFTSI